MASSKAVAKYQPPFSSADFKKYGYAVIDWAVKYMQTIDERPVTPSVSPGWLWNVIPKQPPMKGESFQAVMGDLEKVILEGMVHWNHHQFYAYFPGCHTWPSILGDLISNATGANGKSWSSSPVVTELEILVCDWCCKFLGLPKFFLSSSALPGSEGQGSVQNSSSESIFYAFICARQDAVKKLKKKYPNKVNAQLLKMLVAYCNNECHSSTEKAGKVGLVNMRKLKADPSGVIRSRTLRLAIEEDIKNGLVPFYHCAVIGSTSTTAMDDLMEVGPLCHKYGMWLHVDGAYAGASFALPELAHLKDGFQYVWSFNISVAKWMLCGVESSMLWFRYRNKAVDCFAGDHTQVRKYPNGIGPDLRHYGMPHTRRFKALKIYFVLRNYGVEGLRRHLRNHINLARLFEMYVKKDERFEVCGGPFKMGLVGFRLKGYNILTSTLLDALNASHKCHMVPSNFHDKFVIRLALCSVDASERDMDKTWQYVDEFASVILRDQEKQFSTDPSMQSLYDEQREHDIMHEQFPNPEYDAGEAEAAKILVKLDSLVEHDTFIHQVDLVDRDGILGQVDEMLLEHDRTLKPPPSILKKSTHKFHRRAN